MSDLDQGEPYPGAWRIERRDAQWIMVGQRGGNPSLHIEISGDFDDAQADGLAASIETCRSVVFRSPPCSVELLSDVLRDARASILEKGWRPLPQDGVGREYDNRCLDSVLSDATRRRGGHRWYDGPDQAAIRLITYQLGLRDLDLRNPIGEHTDDTVADAFYGWEEVEGRTVDDIIAALDQALAYLGRIS